MSAFSDRLVGMTDLQLANAALSVLGVIMQMSDRAQEAGGATSISGVATLHSLQQSIQSNGVRLAELAAEVKRREQA